MHAAVYYETGGPEVFRYEVVPDPAVGDGEVLVRVEAVSIEGGDTLNRRGGAMTAVPHIVGYQCAGTVVSAGAAVSGVAVGDRVVTVGLDGSHAELRAVSEPFCWVIPEGLATEDAACVPVPFGTADDCLFEFGRLQPGETALIHAGASGVGIAAIQLAKRAGARVLATASAPERLERLVPLGLDGGIDYTPVDFVDAVRQADRWTGCGRHRGLGRGVDPPEEPALPGLSGPMRHLRRRRPGGRRPSWTSPPCGRTTRPSWGTSWERNCSSGDRAHAMIAGHLDDLAAGRLQVVMDRRFALDEAGEAHAYIESRQAFGRVLLIP